MKCASLLSQQPDGPIGLPDANSDRFLGQMETLSCTAAVQLGTPNPPRGRDVPHAAEGTAEEQLPGTCTVY